MVKQFEDIRMISAADLGATIGVHLQKLFEEAGEVATDVNKLTGRKRLKPGETMQHVKQNLVGEIASNIQLVFILAQKAGITYNEIVEAFDAENTDYKKYVDTL